MKREKYVSGILPEIRQKEFRKSFDNILVMYTLRSRASGICYQSIKYGPVLRILHRQPSVEILQCFGRGFCMVFTIGTRNRLFRRFRMTVFRTLSYASISKHSLKRSRNASLCRTTTCFGSIVAVTGTYEASAEEYPETFR